MKVYQLWADHTYRAFETKEKSGYKPFVFQGKPVDNWEVIELYPSKHKSETGKPIGDVYHFTPGTAIVNEKTYHILEPFIHNCVQVLPAIVKSQKVYVLNFITVIDCLNRENSQLIFFSNSNRIMEIEKFAFNKEMLTDAIVFKIPEEIQSPPLVTEEFKILIEQNEIKGFKFVQVWEG